MTRETEWATVTLIARHRAEWDDLVAAAPAMFAALDEARPQLSDLFMRASEDLNRRPRDGAAAG